MERFLAEEDNVQRVREATERQQMLNREKKNLRTSMKLENVNRIKRIQEYIFHPPLSLLFLCLSRSLPPIPPSHPLSVISQVQAAGNSAAHS